MRLTAVLIGLFALLTFLIPLSVQPRVDWPQSQAASGPPAQSQPAPNTGEALPTVQGEDWEEPPTEPMDNTDLATPLPIQAVEHFKILNATTGKVETVSVRDYVRGAVASEMPATFHLEALKAQAVSAHTYALKQHLLQQQNPNPALKGADFSADPSNMLGYTTEKILKERLGNLGDEHWNKIVSAADSVLGYVLVYEGEPIVAAYHSISSGRTEDASNVWQGEAPYLVSVESPGDLISPALESTATFTTAEAQRLLQKHFAGESLTLPADPTAWFQVTERSPAGYITEMKLGNLTVHGKEVRTALGLKSTDFTVGFKNGSFTFQVKGYGHGVGLSQYGADYMARQGSTFDEILDHYYSGATLVLID